jgi:hypothetical protein
MAKCIRIWPRPNADRSSSHDATRTATIRRLARANEIANTQIPFGTNKLSIRLFIPFVSASLFRCIFGDSAAPDVRAAAKKRDPPIENRDVAKHVRDVRFKSCFKPGSLLPSRSGSILASAEGRFRLFGRASVLLPAGAESVPSGASRRVTGYRRSRRKSDRRPIIRPTRTLRIRQLHGVDSSNEITTSPPTAAPIVARQRSFIFMKFRAP